MTFSRPSEPTILASPIGNIPNSRLMIYYQVRKDEPSTLLFTGFEIDLKYQKGG